MRKLVAYIVDCVHMHGTCMHLCVKFKVPITKGVVDINIYVEPESPVAFGLGGISWYLVQFWCVLAWLNLVSFTSV